MSSTDTNDQLNTSPILQTPGVGYITAVEAAGRFGFTNDHIALLCRKGKVEGLLVGRVRYVSEESLKQYIVRAEEEKLARRKSLSEQMRRGHEAFVVVPTAATETPVVGEAVAATSESQPIEIVEPVEVVMSAPVLALPAPIVVVVPAPAPLPLVTVVLPEPAPLPPVVVVMPAPAPLPPTFVVSEISEELFDTPVLSPIAVPVRSPFFDVTLRPVFATVLALSITAGAAQYAFATPAFGVAKNIFVASVTDMADEQAAGYEWWGGVAHSGATKLPTVAAAARDSLTASVATANHIFVATVYQMGDDQAAGYRWWGSAIHSAVASMPRVALALHTPTTPVGMYRTPVAPVPNVKDVVARSAMLGAAITAPTIHSVVATTTVAVAPIPKVIITASLPTWVQHAPHELVAYVTGAASQIYHSIQPTTHNTVAMAQTPAANVWDAWITWLAAAYPQQATAIAVAQVPAKKVAVTTPTYTFPSATTVRTTTGAPAATTAVPKVSAVLTVAQGQNYITKQQLADSLSQLENSLRSLIYSQQGSGSQFVPPQIAANGNGVLYGGVPSPVTTINSTTVHLALSASDIPALNYFPATSTIAIGYGGTGTSTAPSYGKLLLGNAQGGYDLVGTSSLGITTTSSSASTTLLSDFNTWSAATTTFTGNIGITGNIVPSANNTYSLGSSLYQWKDVYVGPGSIFVNGQEVLHTDPAHDVNVTADINQNLIIQTSGTGDVQLNPTGTGVIYLKGNVLFSGGKTFNTSDNSATTFTDGIVGGNVKLSGNTIVANNTNGSLELDSAGLGAVYVNHGNFGIGTTSPLVKLDVYGDATISGSNRYLNFGGVTGSSGYGLRDNNGTIEFKNSGGSWTGIGTGGGGNSFSYLFPNNATTTGLGIFASTTIGDGSQTGGFTINGGATTTGVAYFASRIGIGTASPNSSFAIDAVGSINVSGGYAIGQTSVLNKTGTGDTYVRGSTGKGIAFIPSAGATTDLSSAAAYITSSGNVGVGTTSPLAKLQIENGNPGITFTPNARTAAIIDSSNTSGTTLSIIAPTTGKAGLFLGSPTNETRGQITYDNTNDAFTFAVGGGAHAFTYSGTGNIGISSTSPFANLSVQANSGDTSRTLFAVGSSTSNSTTTLFSISNTGLTTIGINGGALALGDSTSATSYMTFAAGRGIVGFDNANSNAFIQSGTSKGIEFNVNNNTVGSGQAMVITTSGNIGIGTSTPAAILQVAGTGASTDFRISRTVGTNYLGVSAPGGATPTSLLTVNGASVLGLKANGSVGIGGTGFSDSGIAGPSNGLIVQGSTGVGTSSPFANLSVHANNGDTNLTLFAIGSSTGNSTTTLFSISNTGTTTAVNGFNITAGCYAVNGTCLSTSGGGSSASSTLLSDSNIWSGSNIFAASTTIGSGTQTGGLTINGGATTTGTAYFAGNVGIGTNNPAITLDVQGTGIKWRNTSGTLMGTLGLTNSQGSVGLGTGATNNVFIAGSGTSYFNGGSIGIGTTTPDSQLTITATPSTTKGQGALGLNDGAGRAWTFRLDGSGTRDLNLDNENGGVWTTALTVQRSSGFLGLGTTSPFARLSIHANNGDSNTTLFTVGSSTSNSTSTLFSILNTGNVGVGTGNPTSPLTIVSSGAGSNTTGFSLFSTTSAQVAAIYDNAQSGGTGVLRLYRSGSVGVQLNANGDSYFNPSTGNVGIGTSTPSSLFTVSNSNSGALMYNGSVLSVLAAGGSSTGGGIVLTPVVSAGAPALEINAFSGAGIASIDTNSGTLRTLQFYNKAAGGFQTVFAGGTGNNLVGIGTTSPFAPLSIHANNGDTNATLFAIGSSTNNSTTTLFSVDNTGALSAANGNFTIDSSGRVGIGSAPNSGYSVLVSGKFRGAQFQVTGSGGAANAPAFTASGAQTTGVFISSDPSVAFSVSGSEIGRFASNGLGIGTTSPIAKLSVHAGATDTNTLLFAVASSTASATSTLFSISNTGVVTSVSSSGSQIQLINGTVLVPGSGSFNWTSRSRITSSADGNIVLSNNAISDFSLLQFGGTTSSFPALGRNGTSLYVASADGTYGSNFGVGTSTSYAKLTVWSNTGTGNLLELGSNSSVASTTILQVSSAGVVSIGASTLGVPSGIFTVDASSSTTTISNLSVGNLTFDTDAGMVQLSDIPVSSGPGAGTIESQSLSIGGTPTLTVYGENDGSGGVQNLRVSVGTTTPYSKLSVWGGGTGTGQLFELTNNASTTVARFLDNGTGYFAGNIGIGTSSPFTMLSVQGSGYFGGNLTATGTLQAVNLLVTASSTIGDGTAAGGLTINGNATTTGTLTLSNAGLRLYDTDNSNFLTINNSSNYTANRTLTISTGDANRTISLNGSLTTGGNFTISGGSLTLTVGGASNVTLPSSGTLAALENANTWSGVQSFSSSTGIGTTSPFAKLSVHANSGDTTTTLFAIGSSTASATTTLFSIGNTGTSYFAGNVGLGVQAPVSTLDVKGLSSDYNGLGILRFNTNSGTNDVGLKVGALAGASAAGYVYLQGIHTSVANDANLVLNPTAGNVGIGSTTPWGQLSINPNGISGPAFVIGSSTQTLLTVTNTGLVGVGTTSPFGALSVVSPNSSTIPLVLQTTGGTTFANFYNSSGSLRSQIGDGVFLGGTGSAASPVFAGTGSFSSTGIFFPSSGFLGITTAGVERVRFDNVGNVGIATTSPYALLSIGGGNTYPGAQVLFAVASSTNTATTTYLTLDKTGYLAVGAGQGGTDAYGHTVGNSAIFSVDASSSTTTISNLSVGNLAFDVDAGVVNLSDIPLDTSVAAGVIQSQSIAIGGTPVFTVYGEADGLGAMQNGRVGIGTTTPYYVLDVASTTGAGAVARFTNATGNCTINPTNSALSCSSDERLKHNINSLGSTTLESLMDLDPVTYNWNTEATSTENRHTGFIAQMVQKIFPDLVSTDGSGYLTLNYAGFVPYIVSAIQELYHTVQHFAEEFTTKKLCVADDSGAKTCITKSQLDALLQQAGQTAAAANSAGASGGGGSGTTDSTSSSTTSNSSSDTSTSTPTTDTTQTNTSSNTSTSTVDTSQTDSTATSTNPTP